MNKILKSGYESQIYLGADPELFLDRQGRIVGSERVIPVHDNEALRKWQYTNVGRAAPVNLTGIPYVVRDGVQVELQIPAFTCRASAGGYVTQAIQGLMRHLLSEYTGIKPNLAEVVEVDQEELMSLSEKSRILGCQPSFNIYDEGAKAELPPDKACTRSAGGHIHIGINSSPGILSDGRKRIMDKKEKLVRLCDTLVGNTFVLIDRDPLGAERRLTYGRAGEYRLPTHGLEYRTLSNVWLRGYPVASLAWGLTRMAAGILHQSVNGAIKCEQDRYGYNISGGKITELPVEWDAATELLNSVDQEVVRDAINRNDLKLALRTWSVMREFLAAYTQGCAAGGDGAVPLIHSSLDDFDYFIEKGIDYWFPQDQAIMRWLVHAGGHGSGWEAFLTSTVREQRLAEKPAKKRKAA